MSAWALPDHIADVLPSEARHIEELRRHLLDTARGYGYELVIPPMIEHLESLLSGTGEALDLQTFKLVDQLSGRSLGLRADTTPQVARIDAHLLNRQGVARLCYCGAVLHTRPDRPYATREPLQFGAEIYGHAGLQADTETLQLALDGLRAVGLRPDAALVDMADVRIVRALLAGLTLDAAALARIHAALAAKDDGELRALTRDFPAAAREGLLALPRLYGDINVLDEAERALGAAPGAALALAQLRMLAGGLEGVRVSFDLADLRGYAYYSAMRFGIYVEGAADALVRGGRYDEVGAVFGRNRPAVGFSLDLRELVSVLPAPSPRTAIRAPWLDQQGLRVVIGLLRRAGETVVCVLPGHDSEIDEFHCDRELVEHDGVWLVQPLC
ncbi:MAG: ATP phosphoribosyltransferase regulatory subunit [Burkholderiaceae bacterium]|jgi:ATP phosphoribosyltransferase regulatory subunit|nr:ATP phosphoribosyltransferase regulatory subunit [Burkholderiaceae bacterium]